MSRKSRIALGTAQFGMPYGVANTSGVIGDAECAEILAVARFAGIDTIDTAIGYGVSEQRLGKAGVEEWSVISKLPPLPAGTQDVEEWVRRNASGSLERLRIPRLRGMLLHHPMDLLGPDGDALYGALLRLKQDGVAEKVGVSVYDPDQITALWPRFSFDIIQAPFNVLDRRLSTSGYLSTLSAAGVEVHVRSVFLQGMLLLDPSLRPAWTRRWDPVWRRWEGWLAEERLTPLAGALGFVLGHTGIERVIVGVDAVDHLGGILRAAEGVVADPPPDLYSDAPDLINPSKWPAK